MNCRDLIRNPLLSAGALSSRDALAQQENAVPKAHHGYPVATPVTSYRCADW